jgi:hypothetical protein
MNRITDATIELEPTRDAHPPGASLRVNYQVKDAPLERVEISLGYRTEGKGTEDNGVVFLEERRDARGVVDVALPHSPLTYDGVLIKVRWELSVRAFCSAASPAPCMWDITIGPAKATR